MVLTDFPERFDKGRTLFVNGAAHKILTVSWHKDQVRLTLSGVTDRNTAESLKWADVSVPADQEPELESDQFLVRDVVGLMAVDQDGNDLGRIDDVLPNPANDLLVIGSVLVPVVQEFVKEVDLENGRIVLAPIPGMFDEEPE